MKLHQQSQNPGTAKHLSACGAPGMGLNTYTYYVYVYVYWYFGDALLQSDVKHKSFKHINNELAKKLKIKHAYKSESKY